MYALNISMPMTALFGSHFAENMNIKSILLFVITVCFNIFTYILTIFVLAVVDTWCTLRTDNLGTFTLFRLQMIPTYIIDSICLGSHFKP